MRELVALDLAGGPRFVDAVRRTWDDGDAILVVDQRLSAEARQAQLGEARPHAVVGEPDGERVSMYPDAPPVGEDDAVVVMTSGSTGPPRLVVHTFASLDTHASAVHERLGVDPARDRWLACLPLVHLGGLGVVVRAIATDTGLDVLSSFDAVAVQRAPAALGSTLVSLVPTALDRIDPAPFRWVVLGGTADPHDRADNVVRTYGLTESGGGVVYDGRALPGVQLEVRSTDFAGADRRAVPRADPTRHPSGTIAIRGSTLARGLRRQDGSVEPVVDGDGWLVTGDLGHWDDRGRLAVDGRSDDLIITGGENIWPDPVAAVLGGHPGVDEVTVIGRPDPEWGQRVVAVVVPANPAWPPSLEELRRLVSERLSPSHAPRELVVVDHLPRTALGKVRRPDIGSFTSQE
ncbi:MAG: AMP-binding enzyme [Acidimicrobiales bacterium]